MQKKKIGYDTLLGTMLSRGELPPEVEQQARRALEAPSQFEQWHVTLLALEAAVRAGKLRRLPTPVDDTTIRFLDLARAEIFTLTPPPVPVRDYTIHPTPQIPESLRTRERLALIDPILTSVASCQSEAELGGALEKIAAFAREMLDCRVAALNPLPSPNGVRSPGKPRPISGVVEEATEFFTFIEKRVIEQGQSLYIPDLAAEPNILPQLADAELRSAVLLPLRTEGETFGLLEAWHAGARMFGEDDRGLLALLANVGAGLVKHARRLERLIFVDPLTEVHTRGYFDEEFRREIERSNRSGASLALLMIDVDRFKQVNDNHGHAAGDLALRTVAKILKNNLRQVDLVTRYGGEEFAILMPGVTEEEARLAAERLRAVVETATIAVEEEQSVRLTISIGCALYPDHARSREELLDRADRIALLRAKREGRNRVILWGAGLERARISP